MQATGGGRSTLDRSELLWIVGSALLVLAISALQWIGSTQPAEPTPATNPTAPSAELPSTTAPSVSQPTPPELKLQARYLLGVDAWLEQLESLTADAGRAAQMATALASFEAALSTPRQQLLLAPVAAAVGQPARALEVLEATVRDAPELAESVSLFRAALTSSEPLPDDTRDQLAQDFGWFGELAIDVHDSGASVARAESKIFAAQLIAAMVLGLLLLVIGTGLAVVALAAWRRGDLKSGYVQTTADLSRRRQPFLETLVVFLLGLQILGIPIALLMQDGAMWPLLINWLGLPLALWALHRGRSRDEVFRALGWHAGIRGARRRVLGVSREIFWGLVGYVAAMPLLAFGFLLSAIAARFADQPPYHPIVEWLDGSSTLQLILVLSTAVVWAPILEETIFRGSLYHYFRGHFQGGSARAWVISALGVGLVFAMIHPQGAAGLPFLITLAFVLAMIREWRGSLIGPIAVHAVHNSIAMTVLLAFLH